MRLRPDDAESNRYHSKEAAVAFVKKGCLKLAQGGLNSVRSEIQLPRLKPFRRFPVFMELQHEI
jgi:hypothetical protein